MREAISRHQGQLTVAQALGASSLGQRPTGDVHARHPVGVVLEPASPTTEEGLATPVLPGGVTTPGALLAGAPGVHYHHPHPRRGFGGLDPDLDVNVPLPLRPFGEDRPLDALGLSQQVSLVVANLEGDAHPPSDCGQGNGFVRQAQGEGALVVTAGGRSVELGPAPPLPPHPSDGLHGEVGAEPHRPEVFVDQAVEPEAAELPTLFSHSQGVVATLGKQPHRGLQGLGLFGSGLQGATYRESLHKAIVAYHGKGGGEGAFLCRLKPTVSCARSL